MPGDQWVADREGLPMTCIRGNMADLSALGDARFDLIFHPVSNVFAEDVRPVWAECFRVLRPGGVLLAGFMNPMFFIFDHYEAEQSGRLAVKYPLPFSDVTSHDPAGRGALAQERHGRGVQPFARFTDRRATQRGLRPHGPLRRSLVGRRHAAEPLLPHVPRHPRAETGVRSIEWPCVCIRLFTPMFLPRALRLIFAILCTAASIASGKGPAAPLSSADRQLFAWFDQLGVEDITHARLVRVRDGPVTYVNNNEREPDEPRGFLLWEKDGRFRVLLGDLTAMTLEAEGADPGKDDYVGWRAVSLDEETAAILRTLAKKELDGFWDDGHDTYSDRLDLRAQAFVLARYCHAQGRDDLAARLLRRSAHLLREHGDSISRQRSPMK